MKAYPATGTQRRAVYDWLLDHGPATDERIADALELNPSTERPRRIELVSRKLVRDTGQKDRTRSGRSAVMWEVTTEPIDVSLF